jgi:hypothetical protein
VVLRAQLFEEDFMNRRLALTTISLLCAGVALSASGLQAQQKSLKDQLVGSWTLVSWERINPDGGKVQAFGANPRGVTTFDATGRFSLIFLRSDLPKLASNDRLKATADESIKIVQGSIAYFGAYTVDETKKAIVLNIDGTTFQNQLGRSQTRLITSLSADELKITNPAATAGGQIITTYKRAK